MLPMEIVSAVNRLLVNPRFNPNAHFIEVLRESNFNGDVSIIARAEFGNPECALVNAVHEVREDGYTCSVLIVPKGQPVYGLTSRRKPVAYNNTFTW